MFSLVQDEMLRIALDCARNFDPLCDLARRYEDRKPDLADLCLVRMSELYPRHAVITVDENDFRIYRRNKRELYRPALRDMHKSAPYKISPVHISPLHESRWPAASACSR